MSTPNAEGLLNRAMTLLALAPSYGFVRARVEHLDSVSERGQYAASVREAAQLYEELVTDWLARLDTVRGRHEGVPLMESWRGREEPILSLLPSEPRENPRRPSRLPKRRKAKRNR